jgi:hypothetical protein
VLYVQLTGCAHDDPDAGIAVGQAGTLHCQRAAAQLQVASPYAQLESMPPRLVNARQGSPSAGRSAGQVQRRVSRMVPQAQV